MSLPDFASQLKNDLETHLADVLRENPAISHLEAGRLAQSRILLNNPFVPPNDGACLINELPNELLAYIFTLGAQMQPDDDDDEAEEGDDIDEPDIVDADEEKDAEEGWEDDESESEDELDLLRVSSKALYRPGTGGTQLMEGVDGEEDDDEDDEEEMLEPVFQVLVTHVCRQWREVAIETPSLWTEIYFNARSSLDLTKTWLHRSKGHPIHIELDAQLHDEHDPHTENPESDEWSHMDASLDIRTRQEVIALWPESAEYYEKMLSTSELRDFLDVIMPQVDRWKSFQAEVSFFSYMYLILSRLSVAPGAPVLETLQLHHYDCSDEEEEAYMTSFHPQVLRAPFVLFGGAELPNLRQVALWGVHVDWDNSLALLAGRKELELSNHPQDVRPSYATFKHILETSPDLETLTLMTSGPAETPEGWPSSDFIDATSIQHLVVAYLPASYLCSLFDHISLPNLRDMAIDVLDEDYSSFARHMSLAAPGRSQSLLAQLENLKIVSLPSDDASAERMLEQLARLRHFNLNCVGEEDNPFFVKLMTPIPTATPAAVTTVSSPDAPTPKFYCPALKHLTIRGLPPAQVRAFVSARKDAGLPLSRLLVSEDDEVEDEDEKWLKMNVDEFEFFEPGSEDEIFMEDDEEDSDFFD